MLVLFVIFLNLKTKLILDRKLFSADLMFSLLLWILADDEINVQLIKPF